MKESTKLNTAFTLLNISIILFVMIGGAWHGKNNLDSLDNLPFLGFLTATCDHLIIYREDIKYFTLNVI